ncbi:MAG: aspartate ammonia-lyase [Lentisphaerae bacterium]|nr:aspartate ammonia-lyase [Lentisphaerota bacterium]
MKTRVEKDFLGTRELPQAVYYGINALRGQENFPITGLPMPESLITAIAMVKKAAAQANRDAARLDSQLADAIVKASDEVINGQFHDQFIVDPIQGGAGTSFNMNANEVIANRALEILGQEKGSYHIISPLDHVNMGQSTNDAVPTAVHIAAANELALLLEEMTRLHAAFGDCSKRFDTMIKMGRTHLQDAVPIRLGQEFHAYQQVTGRDIKRISGERESLFAVNLGATAVGTGLNADVKYVKRVVHHLAKISGLPLKQAGDLVDATQNADAYTTVSSTLKICMLNMSKIANDLRLMASGPRCGLGELKLPPRQSGSSIMPGKVNPVMAEVVNQVAFQVAGNDLTISMAAEAGQFELNVMEPVIIRNLLESIFIMRNVFRVFRMFLLEGLAANEEKMRSYVEHSAGVVTAFAPYIGYEKAAEIAKASLESGRPVRTLLLEKKLISPAEADIILDAREMTKIGIAGLEAVQALRNKKKKK